LKGASSRRYAGIPATFDRTGTDGTIVSLRQDNTEEGTISVAGTTVSYNAFMGSHYTQLKPGQAEPATGTVVVTTGREIPTHGGTGGEKFVFVEPSRERNARGTYGVWFASLNRRPRACRGATRLARSIRSPGSASRPGARHRYLRSDPEG
jgi:hypothetical protein